LYDIYDYSHIVNIFQGKVIALCGPSGSGKSTIGQLIERFYEPESGVILIDGVDIREIDPKYILHFIL
jgi:ABC-type multidrug transport system fused ATPase/permease subunit